MSVDILSYHNNIFPRYQIDNDVDYSKKIALTNPNNIRKRNNNHIDTKQFEDDYNLNKYSRTDSYKENKIDKSYLQQSYSQPKKRRFYNELDTVNNNSIDFNVKKPKIVQTNNSINQKNTAEKTENNYHHLLNIHDFAKDQINNALELTVGQLISNRLLSKQVTDNLDALQKVLMEVNNLVLPMYVQIYTNIADSISNHEQEISDQVTTAFYSNTILPKSNNMDCSYIQ